MSQDPRVAGPLESLLAEKEKLDKEFEELHAKADAHSEAVKELKKAVVDIVLELAQVLRLLVKLAVKR